jgi:hypothetical protein
MRRVHRNPVKIPVSIPSDERILTFVDAPNELHQTEIALSVRFGEGGREPFKIRLAQ